MKRYRPVRDLLAEIEQVLAAKYEAGVHPLSDVVELLYEGRHYGRVELVLDLSTVRERRYIIGEEPGQTRSELRYPVTIGSQHLGELIVKDERPNAGKPEDRVLLKQVAGKIALFLTTSGKYITNFAKLQAAARAEQIPALGAAAGEKAPR